MQGRRSSNRLTFNVKNIPNLQNMGNRETRWWDEVVPALFVSVSPPSASYPTGVRSYGVRFRVRGKQRLQVIARIGDVSLAAARDRAREVVEAARVRGVDITERPWVHRAGGPTLTTLLEAFITESRTTTPRTRDDRTLDEYLRMIELDIRGHEVGQTALDVLGRAEMRDLLRPIASRAPTVAENMRKMIRAAFNWGLDEDPPLAERDPTRGLEHFAEPASSQRSLRDDEVAILWRACLEDAADTYNPPGKTPQSGRLRSLAEREAARQRAVLVRWILLTGARSGESLLMDGPELERGAKLWHVPPEHRKGMRGTARAHVFPVSDLALAVLDELKLGKDRVFPFSSDVKHWMDPIRDRAKTLGITGKWSPHDLRRTCSTGLSRLGYSRATLGLVLGHAVTEGGKSTHLYDLFNRMPERIAALDAWSKHVNSVVR